ncbi:hypothetical protein KIL84_007811 [Mauremys mutica]|uniref:PPM-type phosphatase domain-containing protein n=1 Tax=Mauremys mutica TaxID=74926 RepID=A0A9D3X3E7_9SAUR|nr:hypothetical protein KIL84_007811 [Mauremys mutica]
MLERASTMRIKPAVRWWWWTGDAVRGVTQCPRNAQGKRRGAGRTFASTIGACLTATPAAVPLSWHPSCFTFTSATCSGTWWISYRTPPHPLCLPGIARELPAERNRAPLAQAHAELPNDALPRFHLEKAVSHESLVIGAIENAFKRMDEQIERERMTRLVAGGCCALAVVYLLGKVYVANAGDSRAIIIRNGEIIPMSREFTPETERQRLQFLGFLRPELLGNEFTHLEFPRRIQHKELGKKMLYRDQNMNGWAYKRIEEDDLKFPLIYGEGKKARVMATIGVTRGLGDHDLKVYNSNIHIKPFLSCVPEVRVYDLTQYEHCPDDVLVLGTDGLWDVTNDREVADVVTEVLMGYEPNDPCRYTMAAYELVVRSRGVLKERGWRLANDKLGSGDDISVFVIPLGGPGNYT